MARSVIKDVLYFVLLDLERGFCETARRFSGNHYEVVLNARN